MSKKFDAKRSSNLGKDAKDKGAGTKTSTNQKASNKDNKGAEKPSSRGNMDKSSNTLGQSAPTSQHLDDVATYSFRNALGTRIELKDAETPNWNMPTTAVPGIATLYFTPTYGYSADNTSGLNVAIKQAYAKVRGPKSGTAYFDAPDLFMVYGAIDSLYMYHAWMCRLYGLLNLYAAQNRYYPEGIYFALGIDFADMQKHMSNFRAYINKYALDISRFYLPKDIPVFARHMALCSGIFVDKPNGKAQTYIYEPKVFYMYDETSKDTGCFLKAIDVTNNPYTIHNYNDIVAIGDMLRKAVIDSEDFGKIMADVQFAYSDSEVISPSLIDELYVVSPMYNEGILMDINNSILVGSITSETSDITQDVNKLSVIYTPETKIGQFNPLLTRKLLNAQGDYTSPDYVMMMSRHMAGGKVKGAIEPTGIATISLTSIGADVINSIKLITVDWDENGKSFYKNAMTYSSNSIKTGTDSEAMYLLTQFDYHPIMYVWTDGPNNDEVRFASFFGDVDNYTTVSNEDLRMMHDTNIAYLLGIPTDNISK